MTNTISSRIALNDEEIEVTVQFEVIGRFIPATREEPEEHPEVCIQKIWNTETNEDISESSISEKDLERLETQMFDAENDRRESESC